jgi:ABC-type dipeptide/oligopeptide/nickel transport system permease subunit
VQHTGNYVVLDGSRFCFVGACRACLSGHRIRLYGARLTLGIAAAVVSVAATLGSLAGLTAGYAGGWLDALLMRAADAILAIPALVLSLLIAGLPGGPVGWR